MSWRIVVAAVLALLAAPCAAHAAVTVGATPAAPGLSDVVLADDDGGSGTITTRSEAVGSEYAVRVESPGGAAAADGCDQVDEFTVDCVGDFLAVVVYGNGGNDTITLVPSGSSPLRSRVEGGAGNDTIIGGDGADNVFGGDGNDTIEARQGEDYVRGEGGDDSVSAGTEEPAANVADLVDGGPGFDRIPNSGDYKRGTDDDVSVTVDGVADDGEPGENDNVMSVEGIYIEADHANYSGTGEGDDVFVDAASSTIRGLGGDDRLVAYDGNDSIEGGDGNDLLEGGFGNDTLDGGAGVDQFNGDRQESNVIAVGRDEIRARDGNAELINCGIGPDSAQVDDSDIVDASCESIDRPARITPPVVGPVGTQPGAPKVVGGLSIRRIASKGLVVTIRCPAACSVTAELRVNRATARKLRLGRSRVLARGRKARRSAGTARVTLKVAKKARKRFRRLKQARVTLRTSTRVAGATTRSSKALRLKR